MTVFSGQEASENKIAKNTWEGQKPQDIIEPKHVGGPWIVEV
jgi:hypothetical protein